VDRIGKQVRIERHAARHIDERKPVSRGTLGEHAVLKGGQPLDIAVAEWEVIDVEILPDDPAPDRIENHPVLHQPHDRRQGEFAVDLGEIGADAIEVLHDDAEIDRQVGTAKVGIEFIQPMRPGDFVVWFGPFAATFGKSEHADQCLYPADQCEMSRTNLEGARQDAVGREARVRGRDRGHVLDAVARLALVYAFVVDDEVRAHGHHFLVDDGLDVP